MPRLKSGPRNDRVVFTNGCFDILHAGHISYLLAAKSKGHILVIAVNSDSSVRGLKGPGRPVNTLSDRMLVLAALECVDYVTWFSDATPLKTIKLLKPDVLVKGGDWKIENIIGAGDVIARGGKVMSLPYVKGKSTTAVLEKLNKL
ncbi:MAG: hypothetical protein A2583_05400 [Bdellovibrionales bacterium RIFOXYD1_FULL_53_11]|nr:MAG: hypothetical protein A2583_05400 [Bdellovibrionales bacterium RIFOXYD1_FULL_53_11]